MKKRMKSTAPVMWTPPPGPDHFGNLDFRKELQSFEVRCCYACGAGLEIPCCRMCPRHPLEVAVRKRKKK